MRVPVTIALFILFAAVSLTAQVSVIAHKQTEASSLTLSQVAAFYTLDAKSWPSGAKVTVFDSRNERARSVFYAGIGKSDVEIKKIWMRMQLSGNGKAPEAIASDAEVIAKVSSTPGAVGFINAASATDAVKVLLEIK